jgi:quinol monooxygenase YgiN
MSGVVRVSGYLRCAPDEIGMVRAALPEHVRLTLAEPGCMTFAVTQDADDPCRWNVDESFRDAAAFEAHRARSAESDWGRMTAHLFRDISVVA